MRWAETCDRWRWATSTGTAAPTSSLASPPAGSRVWRNEGGIAPAVAARCAVRPRQQQERRRSAEWRSERAACAALREFALTTPAFAPADVLFGLGTRQTADVVRVLWPSGILQSETTTAGKGRMTIEELDRKPSSCPYLYTWNGSRFEFVTDFLGGGEMGDWVGPATWNTPDPDEYVRIRGDQLRARDGRYELRITNELEEAMFLDRAPPRWRSTIPRTSRSFRMKGLKESPRPPFKLYATRGAHVPVDGRRRSRARRPPADCRARPPLARRFRASCRFAVMPNRTR